MRLREDRWLFGHLQLFSSSPLAPRWPCRPRVRSRFETAWQKMRSLPWSMISKFSAARLSRPFKRCRAAHRQRGLRAVYNQLLERLIDDKLLTIHGRLNNLAGDAEVKTMVKAAEDQIIARVYMNRLISQSITEEAMKERYAELAKNTPTQEEVRARHILVDTEADAKEVIKMIQGGQSFEEVAKARSKDPAASGRRSWIFS